MLTMTVAIEALRPGGEVNSRTSNQTTGVADLVASIKAHGLLQPLVCDRAREGEHDVYRVVDGNRRFAALKKIHGKKTADIPIVVIDGANARETSLVANVIRADIHPVDEYRAYAALIAEGISEEGIAQRFNKKVQWVRQRLGLAALAPELHDLWLKGKLSADQAEALTLAPNHEAQLTVWRQTASSEWNQHPDRIRSAIRRTALCEPNDNRLLFVGMDAYRAAGGTFRGDLFTSDQYPDNIELLDRMVAEKASSLASKFRDEGWKWVNFAQEGRHHYRDADWRDLASFEEIAAHSNAKTWTATQKIANDVRERAENDPAVRARFGVVLWLSHKGELECETLQMTREEWVEQQRKPTDDDQDDGDHGDEDDDAHIAPPTEPEKPRISAALTESLSEVMTVAMSKALAGQPAVTLAALLATLRMTIRTYGASPIRIHAKGWSGISPERDYDAGRGSWATEFAATLAIPTEGQLAELSALVATQLDLREMKFDDRIGWRDCRADTVAALAGALSGDRVTAEIGATFDAAAYFSKVSADLIDEACAEMGEPAPKGKKGEKVAIAAAAARSRGWLPPELRTVHYTGPGVAHASA